MARANGQNGKGDKGKDKSKTAASTAPSRRPRKRKAKEASPLFDMDGNGRDGRVPTKTASDFAPEDFEQAKVQIRIYNEAYQEFVAIILAPQLRKPLFELESSTSVTSFWETLGEWRKQDANLRGAFVAFASKTNPAKKVLEGLEDGIDSVAWTAVVAEDEVETNFPERFRWLGRLFEVTQQTAAKAREADVAAAQDMDKLRNHLREQFKPVLEPLSEAFHVDSELQGDLLQIKNWDLFKKRLTGTYHVNVGAAFRELEVELANTIAQIEGCAPEFDVLGELKDLFADFESKSAPAVVEAEPEPEAAVEVEDAGAAEVVHLAVVPAPFEEPVEPGLEEQDESIGLDDPILQALLPHWALLEVELEKLGMLQAAIAEADSVEALLAVFEQAEVIDVKKALGNHKVAIQGLAMAFSSVHPDFPLLNFLKGASGETIESTEENGHIC